MAKIDQYNLTASSQFTLVGTEEITESLKLTLSSASSAGSMKGTVTTGGQPLAGATVKVFDASDNPVAHDISGPNGQYNIPELNAGTYKVTATKAGFITPVTVSVTVNPNNPTTVNIVLTPDPDATLNTIYGKVNQSVVLTPINNAIVSVFQVVSGERTLIATTTTNSSGQYLSPYLPNGDYVVAANKVGFFSTESGTVTLSNAELSPLDLFLTVNPLTNTGTVSGIITDQATLFPIANATVGLYLVSGTTETLIQWTKTNSGGRYLFGNVTAGNYIVKALAQTTVA